MIFNHYNQLSITNIVFMNNLYVIEIKEKEVKRRKLSHLLPLASLTLISKADYILPLTTTNKQIMIYFSSSQQAIHQRYY